MPLKGVFFVAEKENRVYGKHMMFHRRFHLKDLVGRRGEDDAVAYLRSLGYRIHERNYRNSRGKALGELDIVARDGEHIVFVEVKARTAHFSEEMPLPEENITREKLRRMERIAQGYLREKGLESDAYRFDAVLITYPENREKPDIRHFVSIFY